MSRAITNARHLRSGFAGLCLASTAIALITGGAQAAGFNVRSQSAVGAGLSHAGMGTSAWGASSMFWNPAAITAVPGRQNEFNVSYVMPEASATLSASPFLTDPRFDNPRSGDIAVDSFVPAGFTTWQLNDQFWIGMATGAPFGNETEVPSDFAGRLYNAGSTVRTFAATPTIGYKINDMFSVGAGVTLQYMEVGLKSQLRGGLGSTTISDLQGSGFGFGFTAGIDIKPWQGGSFGIGYRSPITHELVGDFTAGSIVTALGPSGRTDRGIRSTITLPETVSIGFRQDFNEQWSVMASGQWTGWSRLQRPRIVSRGGQGLPAPTRLGFDFEDEFMVALGAEYRHNENWTFRAGAAYETSPVNDRNRGLRIIDNDRIWVSAGLGYKVSNRLSFDLAYAHLFTEGGRIDIRGNNPNFLPPPGFGEVRGRSNSGGANIVSFALRYRWDEPATSEEPLQRKF
jgi:long-chain fatty acid transport protein